MIDRLTITAVALALALSVSSISNAALLTFEFEGQVSIILGDDSSNTFSANFAVGDPVAGTYTLDTTAVEQVLLPTVHFYDASFSMTVAGHTFSGPAQHRVFNDDPGAGDGFSIINETGTYTGPALGPLVPSTFFIQYGGMPTTTLSNFDLITDPESLIPLAGSGLPHGFRLDSSTDDSWGGFHFVIDSLTASVPEPGTLVLIGLGLATLNITRTRRRAGG